MKIVGREEIKVNSSFAQEIQKLSGENVLLCYQCRKCAAGCPSRMFMDSTPTELMRHIQLGMLDQAMKKNTIWYCLSCHTCSARCPQDIDIAHVIDTIRIMVQEEKVKAETGYTRILNLLWLRMLKYMSRMYELGLIGILNLLTGRPFKDLSLGFRMIRKGKIRLFPSIRKPFATMKMFSRAKRLKK